MADELLALDATDPRSVRMVGLVARYRAVEGAAWDSGAEKQLALNHVLESAFPATTAETWLLEHNIRTEDLALE